MYLYSIKITQTDCCDIYFYDIIVYLLVIIQKSDGVVCRGKSAGTCYSDIKLALVGHITCEFVIMLILA
jgi:hypothetical protein